MTSNYHLLEMKIPNHEFKGSPFLFFFPALFVNGLNTDLINSLSEQAQLHIACLGT